MSQIFVVFSVAVVLVVVSAANEPKDASSAVNALLEEYEQEVHRLPEYKTETTAKPTNSLNEVLAEYEKEVDSDKREGTGVRQLPPPAITNILGGLGDSLLKPIRDILYRLLLSLADFIRRLAVSIQIALINTACQIGRNLEKLFGPEHFLVRFLREFLGRETSPFATSVQISERLDKIMEIYWAGTQ